jgi:phosphatidyl-myo-inositol dimannoside synthase
MQKILLISRNLPPLRGGMERLNFHMALELSKAYQLTVIGPEGCGAQMPKRISIAEIPSKPLWRFLVGALIRSLVLTPWRPVIVMAGSGLTAPVAWIASRLCGAKYAVYLHGLDIVVDHAVYRRLWLPLIRRCDVCVVNSQHTRELAQAAGIPVERINVLNPGVDLPAVADADAGARFRRVHGLEGRRILLSVGRLTPRKGLAEFVDCCLPALAQRFENLVLLIIGEEAKDALHGGGMGQIARLRNVAEQQGMQERLRFLGNCDDATLAAAYQAADLHVFPVRPVSGDVEGFGMVCVEAAAHGLPTVAFAVGGVPDAVSEATGALIPPLDYNAFIRAVMRYLDANDVPFDRIACRRHAEHFAWENFGVRLRAILAGALRSGA